MASSRPSTRSTSASTSTTNEGNYIGPAIEHDEAAEAAWAEYFEEPAAAGAPAPVEPVPALEVAPEVEAEAEAGEAEPEPQAGEETP